jgi:hypothetical protein
VVPAQERLEARNRPVLEFHDRLVGDAHLATVDGAAQVGVETEPVAARGLTHRPVIGLDPVAPEALGVGQRDLRALE